MTTRTSPGQKRSGSPFAPSPTDFGAKRIQAHVNNRISRAMAARFCRWSTDPSAASRVLDEGDPTTAAILEHELRVTEKTSVYRVRLPIAADRRRIQ
jgi:hypothetical protein